MSPSRPTYCTVNLAAIQYNYRRMREITKTNVMAVVKANAYGHGAVEVSRAVVEVGCEWIGVAFAGEGLALRQAGVIANILVLGYTPPELAAEAIAQNISLAAYDLKVATAYAETARALNTQARLHIKVDTGMGRLGVLPSEAVALVASLAKTDGVIVEGLFTHFASSDDSDLTYASEQLRQFKQVVKALQGQGQLPKLIHAANSAAALVMPEAYFNMVRAGIAIYGLNPSPDVPVPADFIPALEWKSTVSQVKTMPPNTPVSYGGEYKTKGHETIAVIPVGYGDGFRRFPKNVAQVLVGGQQVPVAGRVCMDQIMVNVTDIPDVAIGDEVVLVGKQGRVHITADEAARWWGTINYDVMTGIMARVPRVYK